MYLETQQTDHTVVLTNVSMDGITEAAKKNWLSYWKHFQRTQTEVCAEQGCNQKQHHGVLVQQSGTTDSKLFVVPVCEQHGKQLSITLAGDKHVDIISAELTL